MSSMIGKRWLSGSPTRASPLIPCLKYDRQRADLKFRCLQDIEINGADLDLGALPPDEIAAIDIGMQRRTKTRPATAAGPPPPGLRRFPPSCESGRPRPRAIDQPVRQFLQLGNVMLHLRCKFPRTSRRYQPERLIHNCQKSKQYLVVPSLRANGSRECAPDDRLREAIHRTAQRKKLDCFVACAPRNDAP